MKERMILNKMLQDYDENILGLFQENPENPTYMFLKSLKSDMSNKDLKEFIKLQYSTKVSNMKKLYYERRSNFSKPKR